MTPTENPRQAGTFKLAPAEEIYGELTLAGEKSHLYLRREKEFATHAKPEQYITGILHDLTKVSLIDCLTPPVPSHAARGGEEYFCTTIFPHFAVLGDTYLAPNETAIRKVHFCVDDAATLFYDFDAFGILNDPRPFIQEIVEANSRAFGRRIEIGPKPQILYFTGKQEIFAADSIIGRITASHNPRLTTFGGPKGVGLKNSIFISIEFEKATPFRQAIESVLILFRFLELIAGRPQNLVALELSAASGEGTPNLLRVHWSMRPQRKPYNEENKPHPAEVLIDAVRQPDRFSQVLANWLEREDSWKDARLRFSNSFSEQNHYSVDRLVGSANMFDILPPGAVGSGQRVR